MFVVGGNVVCFVYTNVKINKKNYEEKYQGTNARLTQISTFNQFALFIK